VVLWLPVIVIALTIVVAALLVIPVGIVNALALLPFGPAFSMFSPFLEVSVESTPPGVCTVAQLPWESRPAIVERGVLHQPGGIGWMHRVAASALDTWTQIGSSTIRLQHSEAHSNRLAIETVVKWMQDRVAAIEAGRETVSTGGDTSAGPDR
jgi:hypothetical protein